MQNPSVYQSAIFDFVKNGTGNAIVEAVAGSGKTTTGVGAVQQIPLGKSHIFLAFNKAIAQELSSRGVNARTFHSLCIQPVLRSKGTRDVEPNKLRKLVDEMMGDNDIELYGSFIVRLVGLARNSGVGCLAQDIPEVWAGLAEYHDLELDSEKANMATALTYAQHLLTWSNASGMVDFDDMLYLAVRDGISLPKFDFVFVDEAQDTNSIQRAILRKLMKPTSRLIAVGDPAQAIYGFRGADSNSLNLIADEFQCKRLPLTVTYRCATSIVQFAQQWVSHIEAAPAAPAGMVEDLDRAWRPTMFKAEDLIVCRTTKPLVQLCYQLIKARVPARMMGREVGAGLQALVKRMGSHGVGIDALLENLEKYTTREYEKALAKGQEAKAEAILDKSSAVVCLVNGMDENYRTVPALLDLISAMFDESVRGVTLATIHKSKGLEASTVYWLNSSQCPSKWARQPWQVQQEKNLCYVAATRAKTRLVLIEESIRGQTPVEFEA